MAILPIVEVPDPRLKKVAAPVGAIDDRLRKLADDMLETMYLAPGIGLAAPQIGVMERLLVMDVEAKGAPPKPWRMFNPEITWRSEEKRVNEEGCLSIPDQYADVERPAEVKVRYLDETGAEQQIHAKGLLSVCVQHEIDHLDGILFIDHISRLKREMLMRRLNKARRQKEKEEA